jgi:hypothetical protein
LHFAQINATTKRTRGAKAEWALAKYYVYVASLGVYCREDGEEVSSSLTEVDSTLAK